MIPVESQEEAPNSIDASAVRPANKKKRTNAGLSESFPIKREGSKEIDYPYTNKQAPLHRQHAYRASWTILLLSPPPRYLPAGGGSSEGDHETPLSLRPCAHEPALSDLAAFSVEATATAVVAIIVGDVNHPFRGRHLERPGTAVVVVLVGGWQWWLRWPLVGSVVRLFVVSSSESSGRRR